MLPTPMTAPADVSKKDILDTQPSLSPDSISIFVFYQIQINHISENVWCLTQQQLA